MTKIGVCDVNKDETCRTIYMLENQIKKETLDKDNVDFEPYTIDSVLMDLDDCRFDCDMFITELSYSNGRNGVQLAKRINEAVPSCSILFYAQKIPDELDIYEASHVNCMLKGRHDARLVTFLESFIEKMMDDDRKRFIKIKYDRTVNIVDCRDIMYIRIENRVTKFYTVKKNQKGEGAYYEYKPLSEIENELPDNFIRCHAAAIVNRDYIKSYNHQAVTMADGEIVKIGRKYVSKIK